MAGCQAHLLVALGDSREVLAVLAVGVVGAFEMVACGEAVMKVDAIMLRGKLCDLGEVALALVPEGTWGVV